MHVAWFEPDGLHVVDVWDSPEQFQAFTETQLMPGVQKIGVEGEPQVTFSPAQPRSATEVAGARRRRRIAAVKSGLGLCPAEEVTNPEVARRAAGIA